MTKKENEQYQYLVDQVQKLEEQNKRYKKSLAQIAKRLGSYRHKFEKIKEILGEDINGKKRSNSSRSSNK